MSKHVADIYKRYTPYILFALVFVLVFFLLKSIKPRERKPVYSLNFKQLYARRPTLEIADFSEGENWKGNYTFDSERTFDGEVGMNLFSSSNSPATIMRTRQLDISSYDTLYGYVFVAKQESAAQMESLKFGFKSGTNADAFFKVAGLKAGWNLIAMPRRDFAAKDFDWKNVNTTYVELVSRNGYTVQIAMDRIWAQATVQNNSDFLSYPRSYLNLKTFNKETYLHLASPMKEAVVFNRKFDRNDFSYTVTLAPLKFGTFGLAFQTDEKLKSGYYFSVEGPRMDRWKLSKKEEGREIALANGELTDNTFEKEAYLWVRTEKKGDRINLSISFDNQNFLPLKEVRDNSFSKGFVGIFYQGSYLIDSVEVKE